jgi:hypothetical protein
LKNTILSFISLAFVFQIIIAGRLKVRFFGFKIKN